MGVLVIGTHFNFRFRYCHGACNFCHNFYIGQCVRSPTA